MDTVRDLYLEITHRVEMEGTLKIRGMSKTCFEERDGKWVDRGCV